MPEDREVSVFHFGKAVVKNGEADSLSMRCENGFIESISGHEPASGIDLTDRIAVPSFTDIHTHGMLGIDSSTMDRAGMKEWMERLPETGTLKFVPAIVSSAPARVQEFLEIVRESNSLFENEETHAVTAGARLEGPFISPEKKGAHNTSYLLQPTSGNFTKLTGKGSDQVRIVDVAPELENAIEFIRELTENNITVSIGHSIATFSKAHDAFEAGARIGTHLFNAMRDIHHREPGIAVQVLLNDGMFAEIIDDHGHLSSEMIKLAVRSKGDDLIVAITDSIAAALMPDGQYSLGDLAVEVRNGMCTIMGTDTIAGSTLTMDRAFRNFIEDGFTLSEAAKFTSTNPARALGNSNEGVIAPGMACNITVLDKSLKVRGVISRGIYSEF